MVGFKASNLRTITGIVLSAENGQYLPNSDVKSLPSKKTAVADGQGKFSIQIAQKDTALQISSLGFAPKIVKLNKTNFYKVELNTNVPTLDEVLVVSYSNQVQRHSTASSVSKIDNHLGGKIAGVSIQHSKGYSSFDKKTNTENYAAINENGFRIATKNPLSTFSIDVDAASYSNMRRFINSGTLPPADAVRIEEMINYFDYQYPQPEGNDPVNIITEMATAPWNPAHRLLHIGLQGKTIPTDKLPAANLVFLIDVSGSMSDGNKLPLLVASLKLLTDQLRAKDKVAIVVYAGSSGLVLPSTSGTDKAKIKEALSRLSAGGSTAGGAGINLAYKVATENFVKDGNNRIILATDGDFNVGASSDSEMQRLIEEKRKSGIFLTVLGYGMGNYKDSKMEVLADKGNGNYAYIDNITEAKKVLVNEFGGTLFTIAKDVKLQLEFNPKVVQAYRLIGYENRLLNDEDFNDDKKDAGELGSGHTVTALYEIIPVGVKSEFLSTIDPLKYQKPVQNVGGGDEILTVKLRYKNPDGHSSKLLQKTVIDDAKWRKIKPSANFDFSAAVASFGMLLRQSEFKQGSSFAQVIELAEAGKGKDPQGYRSEFLSLVKSTQLMAEDLLSIVRDQKPIKNK